MNKYLYLITLWLCTLYNVFSQSVSSSVHVNARAQQDRIMIRWAIDSPVDWQKAHNKGFVLYRMPIRKDGKLLPDAVREQIAVLTPQPLEEWMTFINTDQYGAIVAQAIYGDSFEVEQQSDSEMTRIVNMADELQQRYTFALFAADMSFEAACRAGWGYVDTDVRAGEVYAYQVQAAALPQVQTGAYMIGTEDYSPLPKVTDLSAVPDDHQVILAWGTDRLRNTYNSYMIERSADGITYHPVTDTPITDISSNAGKDTSQMFYGTRLEFNNKDYYFRISGYNSFGERGPHSDPIRTQGIPSAIVAPRIINYQLPPTGEIVLEWQFPPEEEKNIKGFEIHHAAQDNTTYKVVASDISRSSRTHTYKGAGASNYFKVAVLDRQDKRLFSQSTLIQPADSIPPAKPSGLEGRIDSLGYVTLKWKSNTEHDLAGYRVLRANTATEEFVDLYNRVILDNTVRDTVSFAVSNKKVYYRILAEDLRYNRSVLSDIIMLEKPDKLPPTAPVFKDYETGDGANILVWINSGSEDADRHYLRRRKTGETRWTELAVFSKGETSYTDQTAAEDQTYQYLIQARDQSGLWSATDLSMITITTRDSNPVAVLKGMDYSIDRTKNTATLYWNYHTAYQVTEIQIYKNIKGAKPSLWKVLDGRFQSVTDKDLKMNSIYEYHFLPAVSPSKTVKGETLTITY